MKPLEIAVIGDRFMQPAVFVSALEALGDAVGFRTRTLTLDWPDEPLVHGYAGDDLEGLKEFLGVPDEIGRFIGEADVLINHLAPVTAAMLGRSPRLRLIAVSRGGPVNIDLAAARARNVVVVNTPGRNAAAVAEFTIGMILAQTRLITSGHSALATGQWRGDLYRADVTGDELSAMTVGVVGYGHIGTRVVRLLQAFGCRILVTDPYVQLSREAREGGVRHVPLETLLAQSDVVSLHARVTPETTGFIGRRELALMKPTAYLVNTARGPLLDYDALYEALDRRAAPRRSARDLCDRAGSGRPAAPAAAERDADPAHRRGVAADGPPGRRHDRRGGAAVRGRRAAAQSGLSSPAAVTGAVGRGSASPAPGAGAPRRSPRSGRAAASRAARSRP